MFYWRRFWFFAAVCAVAVLVPLPGQAQESPPPPATTDAPKPDGSPATPTPAAPDAGAPAARPAGSGRRSRSGGEAARRPNVLRAAPVAPAPGPRRVAAPRAPCPPPSRRRPHRQPHAWIATRARLAAAAAGTDHHHGERRAHQERARLHRAGPAAGKPRRLLQAGQRPARPRHFHPRLQRPQRLRHPQHRRARGWISGDAAGRPLGALLRGLAACAASRLAAAFFATFVDLRDVQLAIAFTRRCLCRQTSIDPCQDLLQVCKQFLPPAPGWPAPGFVDTCLG